MNIQNDGRWYAKSVEECAEILESNIESGLSVKEAEKRLSQFGENNVFKEQRASFKEHLKDLFFDPLWVLLLFVSALMATQGHFSVLVCLAVYLCLMLAFSAVIYVRSNRVFEMMERTALPRVEVVRDNSRMLIDISKIVPGDIIKIKAGQVVPCDSRLISEDYILVSEFGVIESSEFAEKRPSFDARVRNVNERYNMLFAGTVVEKGSGRAIVTETGENTYVSKLKKNKTKVNYKNLKLFKSLERVTRYSFLVSTALTAVLTFLCLALPVKQSALDFFALILAVASVTLGAFCKIPIRLAVAMGLYGTLDSANRLNSGILVRNVSALGSLSNITTLAIPTESINSKKHMKLDKVCIFDRGYDISEGDILPEEGLSLLVKAVISTGRYTKTRLVNQRSSSSNEYTDEVSAIIECAEDQGVYNVELDRKYPIMGHTPARRDVPFEMTTVNWYGEERMILRGDVSLVLARCTYYKAPGTNKLLSMTVHARKALETYASQMMRDSHRVVAIASGIRKRADGSLSESVAELTYEGMIAFCEPLLPGAAHTVMRCRDAGVKIILFTKTVSEKNIQLARSLGILKEGDMHTDALFCPDVKSEEFCLDLTRYTLLQGYDSKKKKAILEMLEERGERVAYYGKHSDEQRVFASAKVRVTDAITLSPRQPKKEDLNEDFARQDESLLETTDDVMRFNADVIVSPVRADGKGGFNALVRSLSLAGGIYYKSRIILSYLLSVNTARLILLCISLFVPGLQLLSAVGVLHWGLLFDLPLLYSVAFSPLPADMLKIRERAKNQLLSLRELMYALAMGILQATFVTLSSLALNALALTNGQNVMTFALISCLVSCFALWFEMRFKQSSFGRSLRLGNMLLLTVIVSVTFIVLCLVFPALSAFFGIFKTAPQAYIASVLPALLCVGGSELIKIFLFPKKKKYKK